VFERPVMYGKRIIVAADALLVFSQYILKKNDGAGVERQRLRSRDAHIAERARMKHTEILVLGFI
jgi:hypothetical protein